MSTPKDYNARVLADGDLEPSQLTTLTLAWQRDHDLDPDGKCGPLTRESLDNASTDTGRWSQAEISPFRWDDPSRARARSEVAGLCVHQASRVAVQKRLAMGMTHEEMLASIALHYRATTGTHYMVDTEGRRIQLGSELQVAYGVGMLDQIAAETETGYQPPARWRDRWPTVENPSDICALRGDARRLANPWLVHIELVPYAEGVDWFSIAQHRAVADLAIRLQKLGEWPRTDDTGLRWWDQIGRVVDHESLSPVTRYTRGRDPQGWDPGVARAAPRFDWELMLSMIEKQS